MSSLGRLSLQVQQAAVWLTDYYWFLNGLNVRGQYTCRSRGLKHKTRIIYSTLLHCLSCAFTFPSFLLSFHSSYPFVLLFPSSIVSINCIFNPRRLYLPCLFFASFRILPIPLCVFLQPEAISTLTSEPALVSFAEFFCKTSEGMKHVSLTHRNLRPVLLS